MSESPATSDLLLAYETGPRLLDGECMAGVEVQRCTSGAKTGLVDSVSSWMRG